ncbi:hypothetical protein CAEBREN_20376 [Caenorhabditis brenneri]|uniref:BTB domain-containing protein n=1 Tax=Caenorhabditis brenneri TaxID=135651 RepID=G0MVZ8_CAEBE|nr:hypothetical protein CAEBREN_20376 [Caenorhabditis brenneri]
MTVQLQGNEGFIRFDISNFETLDMVRMKYEPTIGANYWSLSAFSFNTKDAEKWLGIRLRCNPGFYSNLWACDANVRISLVNEVPEKTCTIEISQQFSHIASEIKIEQFKKFHHVLSRENGFCRDGKVAIEATIRVRNNYGSSMVVRETFSEPKEHITDVALIVEGKKVYVGKQSLAMHSKYFHTLFYSDFQEQGKQEIELDGVKYEEFIDLLNLIYPSTLIIDDDNVLHILKLADRFQVWFVVERCEKFLRSTKMPEVDKLIIAEQFNLAMVQYDALADLSTADSIAVLAVHPRFEEIGPQTMKLLFKKVCRMGFRHLFTANENEDESFGEPPAAPPIPQQQQQE